MQEPKIKVIKDKLAYDGKFIQVLERHFLDTNGKEQVWEVVKRKTYGRIVGIAAITPENEIILEKIYRLPYQEYIIEIPAGLNDHEGEDEESLVRRELLEETGYEVEKVEFLTSGPFNAGLVAGDDIAIYLGTNAKFVKQPELEGSEDIEIIKMPLKNLFEYLSSLGKQKLDIKIYSLIPFLEKMGLT